MSLSDRELQVIVDSLNERSDPYENKNEFLEFIYNKYGIDDTIFYDTEKFKILMRDIKINEII